MDKKFLRLCRLLHEAWYATANHELLTFEQVNALLQICHTLDGLPEEKIEILLTK